MQQRVRRVRIGVRGKETMDLPLHPMKKCMVTVILYMYMYCTCNDVHVNLEVTVKVHVG